MNLIERIKCPFCQNLKFNSLFKKHYSSKELKNFIFRYYRSLKLEKILENHIYEINECLNCKGLFQKFEPDNEFLSFLYDEVISIDNSYKKKNDFAIKYSKKLHQDYLLISNLFTKKIDNIKILEFGSGWGSWTSYMKSRSLDVISCEFSEIRHQHLIKNNIKNYKNLDEIDEKFDFIYSEEVLEHVTSPLNILKKLSNLLTKRGFMFHRFPSSYLFKSRLNKNYIPQKDCAHPLEHLNIFNKKCFYEICNILDLEICNYLKIKNQNFFTKLKVIKNDFIFNNILIKNKQ